MNKLKTIRSTGIHAYRHFFVAKIAAWILTWSTLAKYWVIHDKGIYLVLNYTDAEHINQAAKQKYRVRDLNRMSYYRTFISGTGTVRAAK
jgi:hypothetical protein